MPLFRSGQKFGGSGWGQSFSQLAPESPRSDAECPEIGGPQWVLRLQETCDYSKQAPPQQKRTE